MTLKRKSPISDASIDKSLKHDSHRSLPGALREARLAKGLSQQAVAERLGLHQRQISDLERATFDPRLSTIQNVAGALDLELVLVPRHLITTIQGLLRAGGEAATRPLYSLGDEMEDSGDETHVEVGGLNAATGGEPEPSTDERPR